MATTGQAVRRSFGLGADGLLFMSAADAAKSDRLRGQTHYIRRAFEQLDLDGVLCCDGVPTVYLKKFDRPVERREINELQAKLWNQGTGTLIVVLDPACLYVFSGMVLPSNEDGDITDHEALVEVLELATTTLEESQLATRVATGQYYRDHPEKFRQPNAIDSHLLENLAALGDHLRHDDSKAERMRVHALIGRVVFTCYLIDRRIIRLSDYPFVDSQDIVTLLDLLSATPAKRAKVVLFELFDRLRRDFNGSMFEGTVDAERKSVTDDDIRVLTRFLRGDEIQTGQRSLGFWAYDFSVIPVETISAIYEKFLEEEDGTEKDRQGAFYTPRFLAEMIVGEVTTHIDSMIGKRCLDPACGSGIFLVILFNRIAEDLARQNPNIGTRDRINLLLDVLENQLCGIDINKTACRITCFSLYIAFLDQFDPLTLTDLQRESSNLLPDLLAYRDSDYQNTDTPAVYEGNFFDRAVPIRDDFDIVVGNPPWVGRTHKTDLAVKEWMRSRDRNPFLEDLPPKTQCESVFIPHQQIAHAFMWKVATHVNPRGRIALLLPTQVLLNQTDKFQGVWFSRMDVRRILNLADFRWFLFQNANRPAVIIQFGPARNGDDMEQVEYITPRVRQQDPRSGLIRVFAEDRKWLHVRDILMACRSSDEPVDDASPIGASAFWKTLSWGSPRDVALITFLRSLNFLGEIAGSLGEQSRWICAKGFKPWYQIGHDSNPGKYPTIPIPGQLTDPFIKTTDDTLEVFALPHDTISLEERLESVRYRAAPSDTQEERLKASKERFMSCPDRRLFEPPFVVVNDGFSRIAFVDFFAFYQDSLMGISGERQDEDLLRFLVAYANSKLAFYFIFHTASSLGVERDHVRLKEILRLPFPLPDSPDTHDDAKQIVHEVATRMKQLQESVAKEYAEAQGAGTFKLRAESLARSRHQQIERLQFEIEPLIYRYFDLNADEIILIEDTCNVIRWSVTPRAPDRIVPTTQPTSRRDRLQYGDVLCEKLNHWSRLDNKDRQPFFFSAEIRSLPAVGMVALTLGKSEKAEPPRDSTVDERLHDFLDRLRNATSYTRGSFEYLRGIIVGEGSKIHIFKPDFCGQWTRTAALNDADRVFEAVTMSKRV